MKTIISFLAFALTLALTSPSVAEQGHGAAGGHGNLSERMNSLFPPKEADLSKGKAPAKTKLTSPTYFSTVKGDSAELTWEGVEGANFYHVQVATDPNFKWLVAEDFAVKATNFQVSKLEAGKHYYWRVAGVKDDNAATHRKAFFATSMFETK